MFYRGTGAGNGIMKPLMGSQMAIIHLRVTKSATGLET